MRRLCCLLLAAAGLAALSGCGGPTMAPVKGRVMFNGKPVKDAALTFTPDGKSAEDKEPGKPATGFTDEDGYLRAEHLQAATTGRSSAATGSASCSTTPTRPGASGTRN